MDESEPVDPLCRLRDEHQGETLSRSFVIGGTGRGAEGGSPGGGFTAAPPDVCRNEEDSEDESLSHGGRQNHDNLYRVHMPSLYSCGSSYGSETSIPAAAHTVSNAPVTEYL